MNHPEMIIRIMLIIILRDGGISECGADDSVIGVRPAL